MTIIILITTIIITADDTIKRDQKSVWLKGAIKIDKN